MKFRTVPLAVLFLSLAAPAIAADYACVGTEPFWGIKIEGATLTFSTPENPDGRRMKIRSVREAQGAAAGTATVTRTRCGSRLAIVRGECSDGMSDRVYSHHAVYEIGGVVLYGCCDLKQSPPGV